MQLFQLQIINWVCAERVEAESSSSFREVSLVGGPLASEGMPGEEASHERLVMGAEWDPAAPSAS